VAPLVNELVEHPAIAVLRGHTQADEFEPHPRHFLDDQGVVQEPPAAKDVEIAELPRRDAQLMLVFPGKHRAEEFVVGKFRAKIFDRSDIRLADAVPASRSRGFTLRFTPIISAKACPCSWP